MLLLVKENSIFIRGDFMKKVLFVFFVIIALILFFRSNLFINIWLDTTESCYMIPLESNIFRFHSTVMNQGSCNWWIYGEDTNYYYHFIGSDTLKYIIYPKKKEKQCIGFRAHDYLTWCEENMIKKYH